MLFTNFVGPMHNAQHSVAKENMFKQKWFSNISGFGKGAKFRFGSFIIYWEAVSNILVADL